MTLEVDYLPFATGVGAEVMSQASYAAAAPNGVIPGLADPTFANKSWRQSAVMSAALANLVSSLLQVSVLDDGNVSALQILLQQALVRTSLLASQAGASYTYSNSNIGYLVERSNSGSLMTDILPGTSPGPVSSGGIITVVNTDASAMLLISPGAGATLTGGNWVNGSFLLLGPGQSITVISSGTNYYAVGGSFRASLGANLTMFVATTGSDTNNGLAAGAGNALASMQAAYNYALAHLDLNGFALTVQLANGTYTSGLAAKNVVLGAINGTASIVFQGSTTPSNVIVTAASGDCFSASRLAAITVKGVTMTITGGGGSCLNATTGGSITATDPTYPVVFGSVTGAGGHIGASFTGSSINIPNSYSITGGATFHFSESFGANIIFGSGITVTLSGTPAFTEFAQSLQAASCLAVGITYSGSATGQRYTVNGNAVIVTNGGGANYFPGNSAGATGNGGQYV